MSVIAFLSNPYVCATRIGVDTRKARGLFWEVAGSTLGTCRVSDGAAPGKEGSANSQLPPSRG